MKEFLLRSIIVSCLGLTYATASRAQTPVQLINNSTRAVVGIGDSISIEEFAIEGTQAKQVIVRGIGPSLSDVGIPDPLQDPVLILYDSSGSIVATNDNWRDTQEAEIIATGIPPTNDLESAIVATLAPGTYATALAGKNNGTGVGLNEVYDLDQQVSLVTAIGARDNALSGDEVVLSGFILGGNVAQDFLFRALGPSLRDFGIGGVLADPMLGLYDGNGALIASNNDWQDTQAAEIAATGLAPTNNLESAIVVTLSPGNYTIVETGSPGVTFVETYTLPYGGNPLNPVPIPPTITSPLVAMGTVGLPFSYQFEATDATSLDVDFNTLPDGLFFDPALRAIVGNSKVDGTFQVALSATNASGTTNATLVLTVQPLPAAGPIINSVTSATGRTGSPFTFQISTIGGSLLTDLTVTGLPNGLSVDPMTGTISGTATTDGSSAVTLTATDAGFINQATLQLTFTSDPAVPVIVSPENAFVFIGVPFNSAIVAPTSDMLNPVTYSVIGQLPAGLGLNQETGVISGTPQIIGSQPMPGLAGGVISNVQGFACNASGCGAQSLFFLKPTGAANISTRLSVGTADNVLIGGFITQGDPTTTPMRLVVRGIGPSLAPTVAGSLADPYIELHSGASIIAANDNWMDDLGGGSQKDAIENATYPTGLLAPASSLESAILAVLNPGAYTAVLYGTNNGTGVGLVEMYKLGAASVDALPTAILANISTRGNVQTGDNVMIGGFINQGAVPIQVVIRGIGPSLTQSGVSGVLANPVIELHNPDGSVVTNDDWMTTQKADITATTLAPTNPLESAILVTLPVGEGAYTAIVRGVNNTTGVALVEAYFGNPCLGGSCP